jgi:MFS transporter, NNP family, nitrate/nitrite transporter
MDPETKSQSLFSSKSLKASTPANIDINPNTMAPKRHSTSHSSGKPVGVRDGAHLSWRKYTHYSVEVDAEQEDRATEIQLCNFSRPHMRAFHCAWWGFFVAFLVWFAIVPLLPEISKTLTITKSDVWNSTIISFASVIFIRLALGPLCDKYGPRNLFAMVLCFAAIPCACTGVIQSARGLIVVRFFTAIAGGSFVMCQYWATSMFTHEMVGTANALTAGWGNLGAGVTQLLVGGILFPVFKALFANTDNPR